MQNDDRKQFESNRVVLFCDVHDFSKVMLDLEQPVLDFVNAYYKICGQDIVDHGGRIVKYLGDAILALFEDGFAVEAVRAGLDMRIHYSSLLERFGTKVDSELEVGLSAGIVETGMVGHPSFRAFDVFGEVVNEAAVIGHHRGVAITTPVKKDVEKVFDLRELEPTDPKWRSAPLRIWEVIEG